MNKTTSQRSSATRLAVIFLVYVAATFLLAAICTVITMRSALNPEGLLHEIIPSKKYHKVMDRWLMVWLIVCLPLLLRSFHWRGWRDSGWMAEPGAAAWRPWRRAFVYGLIFGLVSLGALCTTAYFSGYRWIAPLFKRENAVMEILSYALTGVIVGILEETVARGILYRTLARAWSLWPALVVSGALFAVGHFLGPPRGFTLPDGSFLEQFRHTMVDSFGNFVKGRHVPLRMLNLFLMSGVLCLLVERTRTIWLAAGTHAGWVFIIQSNALLTDGPGYNARSVWWGKKADLTDAWVATIVLLVMLVAAVRWTPALATRDGAKPAVS